MQEIRKAFIVNRSFLNDRIDPKMVLYNKEFTNSFRFPKTKLGKLLVSKPQYGANEPGIERLDKSTPRYIRITDINENGSLIEELGKTASNIEKRFFLENNDILLARSGNTVGKSYIHKTAQVVYDCFFAGYMIRFKLNVNQLLPDYFFCYTLLEPYKNWVQAVQRSAGQPNINAQEYSSLEIPVPPISIQQKIADTFFEAVKRQKDKEKKSINFLEGISNNLLDDLEIQIPEIDRSLEKRIFKVNHSEVTGDRLDAFAVLNKEYKISGGKYENYKLREIAKIQKGQSITSNDIEEGDVPVIAGGQSSPYNHNKSNFDGNVITVSASGAYSGYVWYHTTPIFASDCSVIFSKDEEVISTQFLCEILKLKQQEIYNLQQGAGQPHVYPSDLIKLDIPVPPKQKQEELLNRIKKIRQEAKKLKYEAINILEQAKEEVEQMILAK